MTRSSKEEILPSETLKKVTRKPAGGPAMCQLGKQTREKWNCSHLAVHPKQSKNSDNRMIQHQVKQRECVEETEIKRCYGGEENEEKSDATKDEIQNLSSLMRQTEELTCKQDKYLMGSSVTPERNPAHELSPLLENKLAEELDRKIAGELGNRVSEMPGTKAYKSQKSQILESQESETEACEDKEALYFSTWEFLEVSDSKTENSKKHEDQWNNLGGLEMDCVPTREETDQRFRNICMAMTGIAENNLFNQDSRESDQTWNIPPLDLQGKNIQKHISNVFISLKDEISPLAAQEGVDEKCLSNTLASLWKKLYSKLTPYQFKKVMVAIEMNQGGKRLPVFLDCLNRLSAGGDLDWQGMSRSLSTKEGDLVSLFGRKEGLLDKHDEKVDLAEKVEKQMDCAEFESDALLGIEKAVWEEREIKFVEKGVKEVANKKEAELGDATETPPSQFEETKTDSSQEEPIVDKAVEEDMEKYDDEKEIDDRCQQNVLKPGDEGSATIDDKDFQVRLSDKDKESLQYRHQGMQGSGVTVPVGVRVSDHGGWRTLKEEHKQKWEVDLSVECEKKDRQKTDRLAVREVLKYGHQGKPGLGENGCLSESSESQLLINMEEQKVDVRTRYFRTKSCMESAGQGGGNYSWGGQGSNSNGSFFNRNARNNNRRGSEDDGSSSNRNNDRENDPSDPSDSFKQPTNAMVEANIPGQDYKAVRKKHAQLSNEQLIDLLGSLSPDTGPNIQEDPVLLEDVNQCLLILLHFLPDQADPECSVCSVLHSLLTHFAACLQVYKKCPICWQLLQLGLYHVQKCIQSGKIVKESPSDICHQLIKTADFKIEAVSAQSERLWMKMKKYVVSVFHPPGLNCSGPHAMYSLVENEESNFSGLASSSIGSIDQSLGPSLTSLGASHIARAPYQSGAVAASSMNGVFTRSGSGRNFQPSLTSIPESPLRNMGLMRQSGRKSKRRLSRQLSNESTGAKGSMDSAGTKSDDGSLNETAKLNKGTEARSSVGELQNEGFLSLPNVPTDPSSNRSSLGALEDTSLTTSLSSASGQNEEGSGQTAEDIIYSRYKPMIENSGNIFTSDGRAGKAGYSQDPYETQKTYGPAGVMSLPIRPNIPLEREQLYSLETAPTGEPGIGEVVYGTRRQIMKVAQYWARIRRNMDQESYKHQLREEGVILDSAKKHLRILRTRYQKKNQWMRLVHLGNGVAGKCHLAHDKTSDFKFCVKRVHIAKYEENELVTWSDLDHTNIVKLYGAIRHGCKIYIFCEFIAGGSLTSLINEQRSLNRRLSHWMCLRYFKQLLQVLIYLKSRNVLHEDLKADNILIKRNTTLIAVTDFGLARRMNVDSEMKGMVPTGSQTQWSPEKATSNGHGFAADVWAAVCILVHMLSGYPPWTKRYPGLQMLHFVIFMQSPPLADVPQNIQEVMRDLITQGFTVDPKLRPSAADLLKHRAFKILDQGAPDSYYSTLLSSGQAIPNNMLDTSDKGPKEMEEILVNLSVTSKERHPPASSQNSLASTANDIKTGAETNLTGSSLGSGSVEEGGTVKRKQQNAVSGEASGSVQTSGNQTVIREPPEDAAGAEGGRVHEEEKPLTGNFPVIPNTSMGSSSAGAEGGLDSCSGYATSPDSFEDPEECVNRFLSDDIPFLHFTTVPQPLKLYQPKVDVSSKDRSYKNPKLDSDVPLLPRWSLLLGDQSFSGIKFDDEMVSEEVKHVDDNLSGNESVHEINPEEREQSQSAARSLSNANPSGPSSQESSAGRRSISRSGSHHNSGHGSPTTMSETGYISLSEMKPLELEILNQPSERQSPVMRTSPEEPYPTSYYPPHDLFDEHFDSGDLFGDPSMTSMLIAGRDSLLAGRQSPLKVKEASPKQISSLETHISSGDHKSDLSLRTRNVNFDDMAEVICLSPSSEPETLTKPRSSSAPNISMFNQGTADYAIESGKNNKDCPIESESIDLPDDMEIAGISTGDIVKFTLGEEKTLEKKNPGLTLDVNLKMPKKYPYQRNQSTPAGTRPRAATDFPHPKTCPGALQSVRGLSTARRGDSSSGLGTSLSGEPRHHSSQSSETTADNKGRLSSAEMSPSTPKSQFDHQEREFSALEKASQSDISAQEQDQMLAMADLQNGCDAGSGIGIDQDSFESKLASIQKEINDEHEDLGHKYQLLRDDDTPLSPIRVPAKYEEWREVIDLIRSVVKRQGFEHFTLKYSNNIPVDYNAPLTKSDLNIKVCVVEEEQIGDMDSSHNCWCERHEDQLRAMA